MSGAGAGLTFSIAARFISRFALAYSSVVLISTWPKKSRTISRETPPWTRCMALVCLLCSRLHRRHYVASRTMWRKVFAFDGNSQNFSGLPLQCDRACRRHRSGAFLEDASSTLAHRPMTRSRGPIRYEISYRIWTSASCHRRWQPSKLCVFAKRADLCRLHAAALQR